jgi:hypothetical protein
MPDNREAMGIVEEIRVLDGETNKGFIGLDNNRFTVNEYQYIQYDQYNDNVDVYFAQLKEKISELNKDFDSVCGVSSIEVVLKNMETTRIWNKRAI